MYPCQVITRLVILFIFFSEVYSIGTIRKTTNGWIRGQKLRSRANSSIEYYSFRGIPYARPPLGKLRFKDAQPAENWCGIRNATEASIRCPQLSDFFFGTDVVGSEDCLYLDVYIPITAKKSRKKLPVMFWIHGGNYIFLTSNITSPDYFMEKPVVIVEIEYRLGVLGFFTTLDENAKGNMGLKDQVLALKWVQKNIAYFDGDPKKVTIFGESAGGSSVIYHMLSPLSKGLFAGGISESGTPLSRWALQRNPMERTWRLVKALGIESNDTKEIVEKLQEIDINTLTSTAFNQSIIGFYTLYTEAPFSAIVEKPSKGAFLTESPFRLLQSGRYTRTPLLLGVNTEEGTDGYDFIVANKTDINIYQEDPELFIPPSMNIPKGSDCVNKTLEHITKRYFPDRNYTNKYHWIPYESFDLTVMSALETKHLTNTKIPTYFYVFSYVGSRTIGYLGGVGHHEELQYLWYPQNSTESPKESTNDTIVRKRMITMWTNFASTGNPTPYKDEQLQNVQWPKVDSTNRYLDIGFDLRVLEKPYQEDFWYWADQYKVCGFPDPW